MIMNEYQSLFREFFDVSDKPTRKCIVALEDTEQDQLLTALSSKLYDMIVAKVDQIDFGTIPRSRGDITKVDGFTNTEECIKIVRQIVSEYRADTEVVDTVITAIQNIKDRKGLFIKSFAMNAELPIILYNTMVLAIEQSVSFLISVCISYIKDPETQSINAALDKVAYNNTRDNLLFEQLTEFNSACQNKSVDNLIEEVIKNGAKLKECDEVQEPNSPFVPDTNSPFGVDTDELAPSIFSDVPAAGGEVQSGLSSINGASEEDDKGEEAVQEALPIAMLIPAMLKGISTAGIVIGGFALTMRVSQYMLKGFIPMLRNLVYYFVSSPVKMAAMLTVQAQFIEANAYKLQYSTNSDIAEDKKKKIVEKQLKIADKLNKWANKFAVDVKRAETNANRMSKDEERKMKIEDIKDEVSPEVYNKSVLF